MGRTLPVSDPNSFQTNAPEWLRLQELRCFGVSVHVTPPTHLHVEAVFNDGRPHVLVAQLDGQLVGHVLKVIQQRPWAAE